MTVLPFLPGRVLPIHLQGALQLLSKRYRQIRFAQVPERVSTQSFIVLILGNSKSNHLGAQGTFNVNYVCGSNGALVNLHPPSLRLTVTAIFCVCSTLCSPGPKPPSYKFLPTHLNVNDVT